MSCRTSATFVVWRSCVRSFLPSSFHANALRRTLHNDATRRRNTLINPPASTRPPPLTLPTRDPEKNVVFYLFRLGKAYVTFYKDGLKAVFENRRLLNEKIARTPPDDRPSVFSLGTIPKTFSRADWVLLWRTRHDLIRLPVFGLVMLVFGEFTPLIVALVDNVVPYTCRIPRQVYNGLRQAEIRREAAFQQLESRYPSGPSSTDLTPSVARAHVLRSLNVASKNWDRVGLNPTLGSWSIHGRSRLAFLEGDDKNLIEDGGLVGLEIEELRIACAERGIDVLGQSEASMRGALGDWLRLTAAESDVERRKRMAVLLLTRYHNWPETRDFALPEWSL